MTEHPKYPKHPIRAAAIAFVAMSLFVSAFLPFQKSLFRGWALVYAYCAVLSIAVIGVVRLGRRAYWLIGVPFAIAFISGAIGVALMFQPGASLDSGGSWLRVSVYLLYAWVVWSAYWVARGWLLYYRRPDDNGT